MNDHTATEPPQAAPAVGAQVDRRVRPQCVLLTDWFPASVQPTRPGVYEVGHDPWTAPHPRSRHRLTGHRRLWDGHTWRAGWFNEQVSIFGTHPSHQWRGVLRPNAELTGGRRSSGWTTG